MGLNDITLFTYTNSNCKDLHKIYFDRISKFTRFKNLVTLSDFFIDENTVIYDNLEPFYLQIKKGINNVKTEYLLYSQEDYILFDNVLDNVLEDYINIMNSDKSISFIRLIKSGINDDSNRYNDSLFYIDKNSQYFYSTQATIWRKNELLKLFEKSKSISIRDEIQNSIFLRENNSIGLCSYLVGNKVGGHFNSYIYPYIATAIVQGKWNTLEYNNELSNIFHIYSIDKNKRGTNA